RACCAATDKALCNPGHCRAYPALGIDRNVCKADNWVRGGWPAMSKTMIVGARIWDASGAAPFDGDVLVEGNRVRAVSRVSGQMSQSGCQVIDAAGKFLMPGLVEGHAHLSFESVTSTEDLIT